MTEVSYYARMGEERGARRRDLTYNGHGQHIVFGKHKGGNTVKIVWKRDLTKTASMSSVGNDIG